MDHDFGFPYEILGEQPQRNALIYCTSAGEIRDAADTLADVFWWDYTKEGFEYWQDVFIALQRIADKGR